MSHYANDKKVSIGGYSDSPVSSGTPDLDFVKKTSEKLVAMRSEYEAVLLKKQNVEAELALIYADREKKMQKKEAELKRLEESFYQTMRDAENDKKAKEAEYAIKAGEVERMRIEYGRLLASIADRKKEVDDYSDVLKGQEKRLNDINKIIETNSAELNKRESDLSAKEDLLVKRKADVERMFELASLTMEDAVKRIDAVKEQEFEVAESRREAKEMLDKALKKDREVSNMLVDIERVKAECDSLLKQKDIVAEKERRIADLEAQFSVRERAINKRLDDINLREQRLRQAERGN
jgi:chromosome segregation ATPase